MRFLLVLAAASFSALPAAAEIAVLTNGQTLKVTGQRTAEGLTFLALKGGGEIGLPPELLRGLVPDEVVEEIAAAQGDDVQALARAAAERYGLDPELVLAVVGAESGSEPKAVSPKGAQGLMQLMPRTAAELGVADAFDPAANLDGGSRYLESLLVKYRGNLRLALAAYNAGPGAVARHGGVPPYRETQEYVRRVMRRYGAKRQAPSGTK
ncbi:MAG TPA: lytic transglycosylase domain-containing protein [Vicinamibacteria bacterium]